ncbi:MAG: LacI family DNA-binding transcriptional regulator [Spirochaetota bacterium]
MALRDINSTRIAKIAGVSRSTVSKVINDYPSISETTRERVLAAVRRYHYYPDYSARILAGKKTHTLGLFFANEGHWSEDLHASRMISAIIEHAALCGYHILTNIIRTRSDDRSAEVIKEAYYQRRIDGGLFVGFRNHESVVEELIAEGFVVGAFDQDLPGREEPNRIVVNFDDRNSAAAAIDYLAGLGHRAIAVVNGDRSRNAGRAKYEGYLLGLERNGLEVRDDWMLFADFSRPSGFDTMQHFLSREPELPTAVAAVNDSVAFGVIEALTRAGLRVPQDVSVVGMDGHVLGSYFRPPLTTFAFDFGTMLEALVGAVVNAIEHPERATHYRGIYPARLIERESCAAPSSSSTISAPVHKE